jgi:predicted transcriptional regulator
VDDALEEFRSVWKSIQEERPVARRAGKSFTSLDAARKILTPKRLDLLRAIRREPGESLTRLARLVGRDLKHVHEDLDTLARYGLVSLKKTKAISNHEITTPAVPYEVIELRMVV